MEELFTCFIKLFTTAAKPQASRAILDIAFLNIVSLGAFTVVVVNRCPRLFGIGWIYFHWFLLIGLNFNGLKQNP